MYVDVRVGKRGEIVIPAFARKQLGIHFGGTLKLEVEDEKISIIVKNKDVVSDFRKMAQEHAKPSGKIIYGDKLYEEVF